MEELNIDDLDYCHCPLCDSDAIVYGELCKIEFYEDKFIQECYCNECEASWDVVVTIIPVSFENIINKDGDEIVELVD